MAEQKLYEGTNVGQVNISVKIQAGTLEQAREELQNLFENGLPDTYGAMHNPVVEIRYSIDETFEKTEIKKIKE